MNPSLAVLTLLAAAAASAEIPETLPVPQYRRLTPRLATAGQPAADQAGLLKQAGFRTVLNLRSPNEPGTASWEQAARNAGLRYESVPVSPARFSLEDVRRVKAVLEDSAAAPVLLHCATANRVGAVWAVLEVQRGRSWAEAESAARAVGLRPGPMTEAARRVLGLTPGR